MKKLLIVIIIILMAHSAFAAGASSQIFRVSDLQNSGHRIRVLKLIWVADDTTGLIPDRILDGITLEWVEGWFCFLLETIPGSPAPTADYDIVVEDAYGVDVVGGAWVDRSATTPEQTAPSILSGIYGGRVCAGPWTFKVSGNSVNSATATAYLYFIYWKQ
jgi:hypothetical protein